MAEQEVNVANQAYFQEFLQTHDGYTVMKEDVFLRREIASFERNLPLVILGATKKSLEKLEILFGKRESYIVDGAEMQVSAFEKGDIYIEGKPFVERERYGFGDLVEIIRRLRDPDGCPWDLKQTHDSIRKNLLEECYELLEGIDDKDAKNMREESGDVLLQALFHSVIAESEKEFTTEEMVSDLAHKLVFRHTHIFGENKATDPESALKFWEAAKAKEKKQQSVKDKLDVVPKSFPAIMRAEKVQKIIKKTGFDFADMDGAVEKLKEEISEFCQAEGAEREKEGGDILFAAINVLRMADIDGSLALNATTDKFIRRFLYVEEQAKKQGKAVTEFSLEQMEEWYQEYKRLYENR